MNSEEIYLYHHLGMGDHISCHGIVRHFCEIEDKVFLFVKEHNLKNVSRMFTDIKNLEFIVGDDNYVENYIKVNNIQNLLKIGFTLNAYENFEYQFYKMANLPIEYKRSKFYVERDYQKEIEIFNSLGLKEREYVFVHDGGYKLKDGVIHENIKVVSPNNFGLFDWMYVIENAKEIHCIDSSFICLVDCMDTKKIPLFNHRYVRNYPEHISLYTKKKWNILK
jgi:hypothetical protein